jgi:TolA-binding protein
MAMSNRVEELESQVAELQAAVDGLTEELVETRERLRQLEESEGVDNSRTPERRGESAHAQVEHADAEPAPEAETGADDAAADPETETDTATEAEAEDDDGSDGNDIIVA